MAVSEEQQGSDGATSAGAPGPLSRLLEELAKAPGDQLIEVWQKELTPGDRLDRFQIRRKIGSGGFGTVYEAYDGELGRAVAIKTLRPGRSPSELSSGWIKKEAEAVAKLSHPGIVTLYDVCNCANGPYLVMELLEGRTLAERLAERPLPRDEALRVAEEMAQALAHAHKRGVLHRDLKPANILLCDDGRVKLLDFGLAHLLGTQGQSGAGTPAYMAPEQARGDAVDERVDVYSAGVVLHEMLTGQRPAGGQAAGKLPRALGRLVANALSADRANRPRDAQAWLDALRTAARAMKRPKSARRIVGLVMAGLVLGASVAFLVLYQAKIAAVGRGPLDAASPSVAVLPFADMSPEKDHEYFSDGIAEEILNALTRVEGLKVIGRTSSFSFKGKNDDLRAIGKKLDVTTLLEGSVRTGGNRVRVTAQLVRATDGARFWSQTFDRDLADIFVVQEEIARTVVEALKVKLLPGGQPSTRDYRTASQDAYTSYLLGKQFSRTATVDSQQRAVVAFEKAVQLDPGYAPAWAALAGAHRSVGALGGVAWDEARRRSLVAASRAVEAAPELPEALAARGKARLIEWDWQGARADVDRALEISPEDARALDGMGTYLGATGRYREAIAVLKRVLAKDPLDSRAWNQLGILHGFTGDFDRARDAYSRALEIDPKDGHARANSAYLLLLEGRFAEALAACEEAEVPDCVACAHYHLGHATQSQQALDALIAVSQKEDRVFEVALVYGCRGDRDETIEWLQRAYERHDRQLLAIKAFPEFRVVRDDPRYVELLRKMNLPLD